MQQALSLFMEKGYAAAGINEIVQRAGVTKPALYYFFKSKTGLFSSILDTYYNRLFPLLEEAAEYKPSPSKYEQDVFPVLNRVMDTYCIFARQNTDFYMLVLSMSFANPDTEIADCIKGFQKREQEILDRMFRHMAEYHGNLKRKETLLAVSFRALIQSCIGLWHSGELELNPAQINQTVKLFMHGIFS